MRQNAVEKGHNSKLANNRVIVLFTFPCQGLTFILKAAAKGINKLH